MQEVTIVHCRYMNYSKLHVLMEKLFPGQWTVEVRIYELCSATRHPAPIKSGSKRITDPRRSSPYQITHSPHQGPPLTQNSTAKIEHR